MSSDKSKKRQRTSRPIGLDGCGTPELVLKAEIVRRFTRIDGVFGTEVKPDRIILRIRDEKVIDEIKKVAPNMTYMNRQIETVVTGVIKKRKPQS